MMKYGCQTMVSPMKRVLMRRPGQSLLNADPVKWHYNELFDAGKAIKQYQGLVDMVEENGAEIVWIEDNNDGLSDAMFTRDASLVVEAGAVLLRMGKPLRADEPALHGKIYEAAGIPVLGALSGDALVEGGDTIWLDQKTLVVGLGFRSNREGVRQLNELLNPHGIDVLGFDLPTWHGEEACLHLMSVISPLDEDLYLVFSPLIPAALYSLMKERGIQMIEAPSKEFTASYGLNLNVMPLSPRDCIMIDGFPETKAMMEEHNVKVRTFAGDALCMACEGGPTCLTNPILREA